MKRRRLLALVPALALAATGCGSDERGVTVKRSPRTPDAPIAVGVTPTPSTPPEVILSTEDVKQAGTVLLSLVGDVKEGVVTAFGKRLSLTRGSRSLYVFIGVDADQAPGSQPVRIDFTLLSGSKGSLDAEVTVVRTEWAVDAVTISPKLAALLDPLLVNRELAMLSEIYGKYTPEKLWKSETGWLLPTPGQLTTRFGEQRSYNGGVAGGHHSGTDLGAAEGDPVAATNAGRVVLARQLQQRGNMVVIDHGGGLFSGYAHMSSFAVAEGQAIDAGETVGLVGTTGLSTGAHLHWEMAANGVLVDALRFTDGTNGF